MGGWVVDGGLDGVAGVVLAAGAGRRFGMPKALVRLGGSLFVESAAGVLRQAGCWPVVVVLGAAADEVRGAADLTGVSVVDNPGWAAGMGSSLRSGLAALSTVDAVAALVVPVDTPGLTAAAVRRVGAFAGAGALARATYGGRPGHPVLLGREHWAGVCEVATGDEGARPYFRVHRPVEVPCEDVASGVDVDRPEDLAPGERS